MLFKTQVGPRHDEKIRTRIGILAGIENWQHVIEYPNGQFIRDCQLSMRRSGGTQVESFDCQCAASAIVSFVNRAKASGGAELTGIIEIPLASREPNRDHRHAVPRMQKLTLYDCEHCCHS